MKRNLIIYLVVLCFCLLTSKISAQILVEPFDATLNGWTSSNNESFWAWDTIAILDADTFSIISPSGGGGAVVVDSGNGFDETTLTSPNIATLTEDRTFLRFNQYLRLDGNDSAFIIVAAINGSITDTFQLNLNTTGGITTPYDVQNIEITSVTQNTDSIQIKFILYAEKAIWIIDDINVDNSINTTFPIGYIGDSLINYGIPYDLDSLNWPYVPHQVVVDFKDIVISEGRKETIRETWGFAKIGSCCGGDVELWTERGEGLMGNIDILEKTKGVETESEVDDTDLNKYNFNELLDTLPDPQHPLIGVPSGILPPNSDAIVIAILDTGVSYKHDDLKEHIWNNPQDTIGDCYASDYIGWNFVHNNNNPSDDHSHGTHVAGIIVKNLESAGVLNCNYRIMPLKTHTLNGVSNLFNVTCATYYSIAAGVSIINDSWGFYGTSSDVLRTAIEKAKEQNILIITASGNDEQNLDITPQFPGCDTNSNIITVGSHQVVDANGAYFRSKFSNYSPTKVDILALGDNISSTLPGNRIGIKTGTSMSTPAVSAALVKYFCNNDIAKKDIKDVFLSSVRKEPLTVGSASSGGAVLSIEEQEPVVPPTISWWEWCKSHWVILCCILFIIFFACVAIYWQQVKSFFK